MLVSLFVALSATSFGQGTTLEVEDMNYDASTVWDVPTGFTAFDGLSLNDQGVFIYTNFDFGQAGEYIIEVRGFVNYNPTNELILEVDGVAHGTISFPESSVNWWSDPMTFDDVTPAVVAVEPIQIDGNLVKELKFISNSDSNQGGDIIADWVNVKSTGVETDIQNPLSAASPKIHPNPSSDGVVNIIEKGSNCENLSVYNLAGKKIPFEILNSNESTRILIKEKGLFIVTYTINGTQYSNKIVVGSR
jgi:hypothetical protein